MEVTKLVPPISVRMSDIAGRMNDDAGALERLADRLEDEDKFCRIARRLRRHVDAIDAMTWEADRLLKDGLLLKGAS